MGTVDLLRWRGSQTRGDNQDKMVVRGQQGQRWAAAAVLCMFLGTTVGQIDDPELFLIGDDYDATVSAGATQRQRLVPADAEFSRSSGQRTDSRTLDLGIDDPELILALDTKPNKLGESSRPIPKESIAPKPQPAASGKVTYDSAASRILGSFVIETAAGSHSVSGQSDEQGMLGESGEPEGAGNRAGPHPQASVKDIIVDALNKPRRGGKPSRTTGGNNQTDFQSQVESLAGSMLKKQKLAPKLQRLANQYLAEKRHQQEQLESETVQQLSQTLLKEKLVSAELMKMKTMAQSQLSTPKIGKSYEFSMGTNNTDKTRIVLKVDGVEFLDGEQFVAPGGHIVSVKRCKRYLEQNSVKALVSEAKSNVTKTRDEFTIFHASAKKLMHKAKLIQLQQGENPKIKESAHDKQAMKAAANALELSRLAKSKVALAQATLKKLQIGEKEQKAKEIRNDNIDAREAEVSKRETKVAEREDVYKQAAEQLKKAANQLKRAGQSQAIMSFPEKEAQLRLQLQELQVHTKSVQEREQMVKNKEEQLAARMKAFGSAVESIIQKSTDSSGGIADDWANKEKEDTIKDVGDFTASLQAIRSKFNSKNPRKAAAAKDGAKIIEAVRKVVDTNVQGIKRAQDTDKGVSRIKEKQSTLEQTHIEAATAAQNTTKHMRKHETKVKAKYENIFNSTEADKDPHNRGDNKAKARSEATVSAQAGADIHGRP